LKDPEIIQDEFGFTYNRENAEGLEAGEVHNISFSYTNPDNRTAVEVLQEIMDNHAEFMGQDPMSAGTNNQKQADQWNPKTTVYLLLLIVPLMIIALIFILRRKQPAAETVEASVTRFCTGCGKELAPGTNFCNNCGKKLDVS